MGANLTIEEQIKAFRKLFPYLEIRFKMVNEWDYLFGLSPNNIDRHGVDKSEEDDSAKLLPSDDEGKEWAKALQDGHNLQAFLDMWLKIDKSLKG